jgi:hypothetical protein
MRKFIIDLLFRDHYKKLKEFQELATHAEEQHHVDSGRICDFLIKCNIKEEAFVKMWRLCNKDYFCFLLCMWKCEAGQINKEDIHRNIINSNKLFFIKG